MNASFTLSDQHEVGGSSTWRLKDAEIRYRGSGQFAGLVDQRIPAATHQVLAFRDALDLLDVWSWRSDYSPEDLECGVLGGSVWTFAAAFPDRECRCGGSNGYPSFADASLTTLDRGRFACLIAAMYACFEIELYIHVAAHHRRRDAQGNG